MLHEVLLQKVSDLQFIDERECRYLLTTIGDHGELVLKEVDVELEAISRLYPEGEEVVTTPLGFLASGIFCEEGLDDHQQIVERAQW